MPNDLLTPLTPQALAVLSPHPEHSHQIALEVETRIGRALLTDAIPDGATIRVDLKGDELVVTHDDPQPATTTAA